MIKLNAKWASYPYILWMLLFTILPLLLVIYFAFTDKSGAFTLDNVKQSVQYLPTLVKSIYLAAIATAICLVLAYPFAFAMSRLSFSRQKMMTMLVMLPMWMNFLLRTYAWQAILEDNGVINTILNSLGLSSLKLINTSGAVVLGMVYNYIPFMILPLYSIMTKIDKSLIEAAGDLGAGFLPRSGGWCCRSACPASFPERRWYLFRRSARSSSAACSAEREITSSEI